jgi:hypothetical protein
MTITQRVYLFSIFAFFSAAYLQAEIFTPSKDRWSVGGSAALPFKGTEKGVLSLKLNLESTISWFIFDHIEITARPKLGITILSGEMNGYRDPTSWGMGISTRYIFGNKQMIYPYVGLLSGISLQNWWAETIEWRGGAWTGFLVALTDTWVLDVSFPVTFVFSSSRFRYVEVMVGQAGLSYYF